MKTLSIATLNSTLSILDSSEHTQDQFLIAVSVASKSDTAKAVVANALNNDCALLLSWLNTESSQELLTIVKNHIQRSDGRYASKTHTLALQGGVWSYVARTADDMSKIEKTNLIKWLAEKDVKATLKHELAALQSAQKILSLAQDNELVLKEAGYTVPALNLDKPELVQAEFDNLKTKLKKALDARKALYAQKAHLSKLIANLNSVDCAKVNTELLNTIRMLPVITAEDTKLAQTWVQAANDCIKYKLVIDTLVLSDIQDAIRDHLDIRLVDAEVKQGQLQDLRDAAQRQAAELRKENEETKAELAKTKEQVTSNQELTFCLGRSDTDLAQSLRDGITRLVSGWLQANREHTSADARMVAAKTLHDYAVTLQAQCGSDVQRKAG